MISVNIETATVADNGKKEDFLVKVQVKPVYEGEDPQVMFVTLGELDRLHKAITGYIRAFKDLKK